jgi:leader peptidase (prepilin peptidase)/N-methyltransferase
MIPSNEYTLPPHTLTTIAIFAFAFGCCVGSYLNVVIYRLPIPGLSTSKPRRSFCPLCKYQIPMWQNIPIVSWLMLRGKCANCKAPISPRYLFVELLTGLLFLLAFMYFGWNWNVLAAWTFISLCIAGSYIDMDHQILPHEITWGGAAAGVVASALIPNLIVEGTWWANLLHSLGGAALGYGLIFAIVQLGKMAFGRLKLSFDEPVEWSVSQAEGAEEPIFKVADQEEGWSNIFNRTTDRMIIRANTAKLDDRSFENVILTMSNDSVTVVPQAGGEHETISLEKIKAMSGTCTNVEQPREAMGMGDANWMACVGAFFGWKAVLFTILAGSVIGAFISLLMIVLRRREWAARIPFGPYLAAGAMIWLFLGPRLLEWYLSLGRSAPEVS